MLDVTCGQYEESVHRNLGLPVREGADESLNMIINRFSCVVTL